MSAPGGKRVQRGITQHHQIKPKRVTVNQKHFPSVDVQTLPTEQKQQVGKEKRRLASKEGGSLLAKCFQWQEMGELAKAQPVGRSTRQEVAGGKTEKL